MILLAFFLLIATSRNISAWGKCLQISSAKMITIYIAVGIFLIDYKSTSGSMEDTREQVDYYD